MMAESTMSSTTEEAKAKAYWFVGAAYKAGDQTPRFLQEGIWENGYPDKYLDLVRSVQIGDRIAIKSVYTRTREDALPFDNRDHTVSVMGIKAIGTVTENIGDGRTLKVDWEPCNPPREWYFRTYWHTICRVLPKDWITDALIRFAFEGKAQDIDRFRNSPSLQERFGDNAVDKNRFGWTSFYKEMADKLLTFRNRRDELVDGIHTIASKFQLSYLEDQFADGSSGPLEDICPFTVIGIFNRKYDAANAKRRAIAHDLASLLGMSESVPNSFDGIPILNNQRSWFFGFDKNRQPEDIDTLWEVFAQAIAFVKSDEADIRSAFISAYDNATQIYAVKRNLTMGLYWIRPWDFPTLDTLSGDYIKEELNIQIGTNGPKGYCNANDYLAVRNTLKDHFQEDDYPVHSFPKLSYVAWLLKPDETSASPNALDNEEDTTPGTGMTATPIQPYSIEENRFAWTRFYEEVADKLLTFRNRRDELVAGIHTIAAEADFWPYLRDKFVDTSDPVENICPFTTMGILTQGVTSRKYKALVPKLSNLLGIPEPAPSSFDGLPDPNNEVQLFFNPEKKHKPEDIDTFWEVFAKAIAFAKSDDSHTRQAFASAYDNAAQIYGMKWSLGTGLYWIRPKDFLTLDIWSRNYIAKELRIQIGTSSPKGHSNADDYLTALNTLKARFQEDACPVHSFPELAYAAWRLKLSETSAPPNALDNKEDTMPGAEVTATPIEPYSVDDILTDGCFIARERLEEILERLRTKKNLILQGPPGTGKTWLAKRLAFALMEERDDNKVRAVQFHPNLSYEDFIRGLRPGSDSKLALVDGPFLEMIAVAKRDPTSKHVVVIEEINRGNPAQIFGEMLTLLEADKRTPSASLELSYRQFDGERVFIPNNLYVIGTMNIADRSLALVDLALRRRFAFIDLEPTFGKPWRDWVQSECGIDSDLSAEIEKRLAALNNELSTDAGLGPQFQVGHSYVTPPSGAAISDARKWFRQVVNTEIKPLLDEYWFDDLDKAKKARKRLLKGF